MSNSRDFSSQSYTPGTTGTAKSVDTSDRQQEKKDLVELNDKFVRLIYKVSHLEDEKRKLEKELEILKEYEEYKGKIVDIVNQEKNELNHTVETLSRNKEKVKAEQERNLAEKDNTKKRFEAAQKKKDDLEKEFILAKRELDESQLEYAQVWLDRDDVVEEFKFLSKGFDEEIRELQSQVREERVVLSSNNKRSLDMDDIIQSAKIQYANMAIQSREEAERWYKIMMEGSVNEKNQQEKQLNEITRFRAELIREIQRFSVEEEALKRKEVSLTKQIKDIHKHADAEMDEELKRIAKTEEDLKRANKEYAGLLRDYQEMMNLKLKRDIEIDAYRKLLEGEEARYEGGNQNRRNTYLPSKQHPPEEQHLPLKPETPQAPDPSDVSPTALTPPRTDAPQGNHVLQKHLLIRVYVETAKVVSEKSYYTGLDG